MCNVSNIIQRKFSGIMKDERRSHSALTWAPQWPSPWRPSCRPAAWGPAVWLRPSGGNREWPGSAAPPEKCWHMQTLEYLHLDSATGNKNATWYKIEVTILFFYLLFEDFLTVSKSKVEVKCLEIDRRILTFFKKNFTPSALKYFSPIVFIVYWRLIGKNSQAFIKKYIRLIKNINSCTFR